HAHRSVLLIESVRLGRYHLGLSTEAPGARDLIHCPIVREPMVLVAAAPGTSRPRAAPLVVIEANSATWRAVQPQLREHHPRLLAAGLVPVESFGAALQMARAGFGDALVPLGLVWEMGAPRGGYRRLRGVERPIGLITRKSVYLREDFGR